MNFNLEIYNTLIFDCDGVILNSNPIKTEAFRLSALPYGQDAVKKLIKYHIENGGISRYKKLDYFLKNIVTPRRELGLDILLKRYAEAVAQGLMQCEIAHGLAELRAQTLGITWLIVSGGDHFELQQVFKRRGLIEMFNGGIHGSPEPKDEILSRLEAEGTLKRPALFLGDSLYDYKVASEALVDFLFISGWSEVEDSIAFVRKNRLSHIRSISDLCHTDTSAGGQFSTSDFIK